MVPSIGERAAAHAGAIPSVVVVLAVRAIARLAAPNGPAIALVVAGVTAPTATKAGPSASKALITATASDGVGPRLTTGGRVAYELRQPLLQAARAKGDAVVKPLKARTGLGAKGALTALVPQEPAPTRLELRAHHPAGPLPRDVARP